MYDSQAAICEIRTGRWVRNGSQIRSQVRLYVECHFCNSIQDLDIFLLQVKCFENFFSWFMLSRNFCFFVLELLHVLHLKNKVKDKYLGNWRLYIKESLVICFRSVPCFWILMSSLISWLRGLFNLLYFLPFWVQAMRLGMMIMNSLYSF